MSKSKISIKGPLVQSSSKGSYLEKHKTSRFWISLIIFWFFNKKNSKQTNFYRHYWLKIIQKYKFRKNIILVVV